MKRVLIFTLVTAGLLSGTAVAQTTNSGSSLNLDNRTDQQRIEFLHRVAQAYFAEKDYVSAVSAYERVLQIDPRHKETRYIIGHVYISAKQYKKAEKLLRSLVEENPEDFQLLNNLAWLYATAEDPAIRDGKKAVKIAQEAMAIEPNDHHVWSTLAEAYYVTGDYEKAFRAITHMARVAQRYGKNVTKEQVDEYNAQIRKCKRALDAQKMLEGDEDSDESEADTAEEKKDVKKPSEPQSAQ